MEDHVLSYRKCISNYACVHFCECSNSDTGKFSRLLDLVCLGILAFDQTHTHQRNKDFSIRLKFPVPGKTNKSTTDQKKNNLTYYSPNVF